jgi:hypothetical protein
MHLALRVAYRLCESSVLMIRHAPRGGFISLMRVKAPKGHDKTEPKTILSGTKLDAQ